MRFKFLTRNIFVSVAVVGLASNALPAIAGEHKGEHRVEHHGTIVQTKVQAPLKITFDALKNLRNDDPDGTRILSSNENECVVEEIFDKLPVIGTATCVYKETYEAPNRVAFKMIRSDKLKAFEGEWTLTEVDNGKATLVKLQSYVDTGLKIPFAKQMTAAASHGEVKQHVETLKKHAELRERKIAADPSRHSL